MEFSELVLAGIALLVDQSHSLLPLRSAKAREFGELWREKCTRAPWTFQFKLVRTSSFRPARTDRWKANLDLDLRSRRRQKQKLKGKERHGMNQKTETEAEEEG